MEGREKWRGIRRKMRREGDDIITLSRAILFAPLCTT